MKTYHLVLTQDVKEDLRRSLHYLQDRFKNVQAVKNVRNDFYQTAASLRTIAGSIQEPDSLELCEFGIP